MRNRVISYSLIKFLKLPEIIIIGFSENDLLCSKYIEIYEFRGEWGDTWSTVHFLFIIQKNEKST